MKYLHFITIWLTFVYGVMSLAQQGGDNDDGKKSTTPATSIWTTVTKHGSVIPIHTKYSQSFMTTYSAAKTDDVKSGNIGLASSKSEDQVGGIRSYEKTTISSTDGGSVGTYSGIFGVLAVVIGFL